MSSDTITLELDKYESGVVFHSLKDKRNQMLKEGKDTELPMLVVIVAAGLVGGLIGGFIGQKALKKHFIKAGLVSVK